MYYRPIDPPVPGDAVDANKLQNELETLENALHKIGPENLAASSVRTTYLAEPNDADPITVTRIGSTPLYAELSSPMTLPSTIDSQAWYPVQSTSVLHVDLDLVRDATVWMLASARSEGDVARAWGMDMRIMVNGSALDPVSTFGAPGGALAKIPLSVNTMHVLPAGHHTITLQVRQTSRSTTATSAAIIRNPNLMVVAFVR